MTRTDLYIKDALYIRRQVAAVDRQLALFLSRPEEFGEVMRVGLYGYRLRNAHDRSERAWRRWAKEAEGLAVSAFGRPK